MSSVPEQEGLASLAPRSQPGLNCLYGFLLGLRMHVYEFIAFNLSLQILVLYHLFLFMPILLEVS